MNTSTLVKNTINEMVENNTLSVETLTQTLTEQDIECKVELTDGNWDVYFKTEDSTDGISMTHLQFNV